MPGTQRQAAFDPTLYPNLSSTALILATVIDRETPREHGNCRPSAARLARLIGRSVRTVQLRLKELDDAGLIVLRRPADGKGVIISRTWRTAPKGGESC